MGKSRQQRRAEKRRAAIALAEPRADVVPIKPAAGEIGHSGTSNWAGRIHAEANAKLQWERAYGTPGGSDWGVWEKLERTDHAVASALNLIAAPLRDAAVELEPADESDLQQHIADFVRDCFLEWLEPRWPTLTEQIVRYGLGYGFSLHEEVYGVRPDERVPGGQAVYLRKLAQRLPSSVKSDGWLERNGELYAIKQAGYRDGRYVEVELPAEKVLLATWNRTGSNFAGFSAFRPIWYLATIRAELLRIIAIGHQREALGVPVAMPGEHSSLDDGQLDELQDILENLVAHENAAIVLPKGVDIEWVHSAGANKSHVLETWKGLGLAILETVQAQQTYLGTDGTGSRAVGEVHDATKNAFVEGVRAWLESVLNGVGAQPYTGIVRKLVDLNFGPQRRYPTLRLVSKKAQLGASEFASAFKTLSDAKAITVTGDDENDIREKLGLRPIDPEVREAEQAKREAAAAAIAEVMKQPDAEEEPETRRKAALSDAPAFSPRRPLRETERHLDLAAMDAFHTQARLDFEAQVRDILGGIVRAAEADIEAALADGDPSELSVLSLTSPLLNKAIEVFIERARAYGYRTAQQERRKQVPGLAQRRRNGKPGIAPMPFADRAARILRLGEEEDDKAPGVPDVETPSAPEPRVDKLVKAQAAMVANRVKNRLKTQVMEWAIDVAREGGTAEEVVEGVQAEMEESKALRTDAGLVIARSFSMGRDEFATEHADEIAGMERSAVLDLNACSNCASKDGATFDYEDGASEEWITPDPNCDGQSNCRCLNLIVWKSGGGFER